MKLIICVDTRGGMLFCTRRVSRDRAVYERILQMEGGILRMAPYSRPLFPSDAEIWTGEDFLEKAGESDRCFVETEPPEKWLERAHAVVVFCWNRAYPSDLKFSKAQLKNGWQLVSAEDFPGNSHERITIEVYKKCEKDC